MCLQAKNMVHLTPNHARLTRNKQRVIVKGDSQLQGDRGTHLSTQPIVWTGLLPSGSQDLGCCGVEELLKLVQHSDYDLLLLRHVGTNDTAREIQPWAWEPRWWFQSC